MKENNETFSYTYSSEQEEELNEIQRRYDPPRETKLDRLRRLDKQTKRVGTVVSLIVGILGTLIMGVGMCCCLEWSLFVVGIIIGVVGICGIIAAYPLYIFVSKKQREKNAPEILRLIEEIRQGRD